MELIHQNHHLHFFSNNSDIDPSSSVIRALRHALPEHQLVPVPSSEFNTATGQNREYLTLVTPDQKLRLELPSNEIIIYSFGNEDQEEFKNTAYKIINGLSTLFPLKMANRLSVLNSMYFKSDVEQYEKLYEKLFTYRNANPFEWDNRIVERRTLSQSNEMINSISSIRRAVLNSQFFNNGSPIDLINFDIDSNTIFQNKDRRFTLSESHFVIDELFENNKRIIRELERYF